MKNSNVKNVIIEDPRLLSPSTKFFSNQKIKQIINKQNHQSPQIDYIFKTSTEPSNLKIQLKIYDQDDQNQKYNQIDSFQPNQLKSFSQQRYDRYSKQKKERYRSQNHALPLELEPLEFQENKQDFFNLNTKKVLQRQKYSPNYSNDKVKSNHEYIDENIEQIIHLKLQQMQKNKHTMFLKNEQRKSQNNISKTSKDVDINGENLIISPSKLNNMKERHDNSQKKRNEFDQIIQQEKFLNQKIQKHALQKKGITNVQSILENQFSSEDKINLIINKQTHMLLQCNQNKDKQQSVGKSRNSQILHSPLTSIKKEVQAYSEDICLPQLSPIQLLSNKAKLYMLNKRNAKKSYQRENNVSINDINQSKISQCSNSPEISFISNSNYLRRVLETNSNQEQVAPIIQEDILKDHLENAEINFKQGIDEKESITENITPPFDISQKDKIKIQQERQKLGMIKKSNINQFDCVDSDQVTIRKENDSQTKNYKETEEQKSLKEIPAQDNTPRNKNKFIRLKHKQQHYLNTDFNIIQSSIENIRLNNYNQNNQIILPQLKLNENLSKISNPITDNTENITQSIQNQNQNQNQSKSQSQNEIAPIQLQETSADFFQLQSYYHRKYNNNDKMPKNFNSKRQVYSVQNSLSKNQMIQNINSNVLDDDMTNGSINCQTTKRRSSSFFQIPQRKSKIKSVLINQNSLSINIQNQLITKNNQNSNEANNDLQPWENLQNLNETNFFQIIKDRTNKLAKNKRKSSKSQSKLNDKLRCQSQDDKSKQKQ